MAIVGCAGVDWRAERALSSLKQAGVDTQFIVRDASTPTGVALIQVNQKGSKQIVAVSGANKNLQVSHLPEKVIASAGGLLTQLESPVPVVEAAIRMARQAGVKVVLDPAPAVPLSDDLLRQVDMIKPDAAEAETLTGIPVHDRASARKAAEQLLARGAGAVAVQAGDEGNLLAWKGGESWNPVLPVEVVDTTGAGDAMAAALAVGLVEGWPLEEIGPFANAAAALATTALGGQGDLPHRKDVEKLLESTRKK